MRDSLDAVTRALHVAKQRPRRHSRLAHDAEVEVAPDITEEPRLREPAAVPLVHQLRGVFVRPQRFGVEDHLALHNGDGGEPLPAHGGRRAERSPRAPPHPARQREPTQEELAEPRTLQTPHRRELRPREHLLREAESHRPPAHLAQDFDDLVDVPLERPVAATERSSGLARLRGLASSNLNGSTCQGRLFRHELPSSADHLGEVAEADVGLESHERHPDASRIHNCCGAWILPRRQQGDVRGRVPVGGRRLEAG